MPIARSGAARLLSLPPARLAVLAEAVLLTGAAALVVRLLPYRSQRRFYGRPVAPPAALPAPGAAAPAGPADLAAESVRWAIGVVQRRLPVDGTCLVGALAGRLMLRRRGIPSTLFVGAARGPGGAVRMHAWLLQGVTPITGAREARDYSVLGAFE